MVGTWICPHFVIFWFLGTIWDPGTLWFFDSFWRWSVPKSWWLKSDFVRARRPGYGWCHCRCLHSCFPYSGTFAFLIYACIMQTFRRRKKYPHILTILQVVLGSFLTQGYKGSKSANQMGNLSSPPNVPTAGQSSSPSRGTLSESSGGAGSPLNQSTDACNNNNTPQGISGMPWK